MNINKIPRHAALIIAAIEAAGYEAYLVGGCVRDMLLGRTPSDWDIASSAPPQEMIRLFEKTVPTGIRFGTVTVFCAGEQAEVTTYRSECAYADFRRPSSVSFGVDIKTDLSRRDFTINAMACHPQRGLYDPFGGQSDLENRVIRAVGEPCLRFGEDALRILRAYRFAAQLGFAVDEKTAAAAYEKAGLVSRISGERIKIELDKTLGSDRPDQSLAIAATGALCFLGIPKTAPKSQSLCAVPAELCARWAAFLDSFPCDAPMVLQKLRFDGRTREKVLRLLSALKRELPKSAAEIKMRLSDGFSPQEYKLFLNLYAARSGCDVSGLLATLAAIVRHGEPYCIKMLAVSGSDLQSLGVKPGPELGNILKQLLERVIANPALNDKNTLIRLAKELLRVN